MRSAVPETVPERDRVPTSRPKHRPQRSCVACRQTQTKRDLVRLARASAREVRVDESGRAPGRGAYLCRDRACWERALAGDSIGRALRVRLQPDDRAALEAYATQIEPAAVGGGGRR
jgi:hypothetical protein